MFGLNESTQYYVCQRYVRMNMGINGLYQIVRTEMELPPLGGAVFIFFSKNRQQVTDYILCHEDYFRKVMEEQLRVESTEKGVR